MSKTLLNKEQFFGLVEVVNCIGRVIEDLGQVPSGHLYANLMGKMDLNTYNEIIGILVESGKVKQESHLLTWIG